MSRLFVTGGIDPSRRNALYERIPQTHGERRRIHGPIQPMRDPARDRADHLIGIAGAFVACFCIGYFALQLLRLAA